MDGIKSFISEVDKMKQSIRKLEALKSMPHFLIPPTEKYLRNILKQYQVFVYVGKNKGFIENSDEVFQLMSFS